MWLVKQRQLAFASSCCFSGEDNNKEGWPAEAGVLYQIEGLMQVSIVDDLFIKKRI